MSLDVKDISRIMRLCTLLGVSRFRNGELEVEFGGVPQLPHRSTGRVGDKPLAREKVERDSLSILEQDLRERQVENLLIEDPEQYERLQMQGELDGGSEDARGTEPALQ